MNKAFLQWSLGQRGIGMNYTEGTSVLDGWTIVRKLGSGSFGTVYQIERKDEYGICERSALKVISVPQSPEDMKEILDEGMNDREASTYFNSVMRDIVREIAVMVETKSCEHIVRYEAHKVIAHENGIGGDILIRMELLTSLPEYRRTHEMNENDVIRMGRDLADALTYCERKGLIHRDIKPQNIFVTENGSFKLGDFGIARRMQRTTGASRKGTEDYMAPEVYLRRHYGTTVDIYSLGLVMYKYANYGRLPFLPLPPTPPSFDDREQSLQNRMNGTPLPPPAEASEDLSAIILKACAYDPQKRYRSAGDLKADLVAVLQGEKINPSEKKVVHADVVCPSSDPSILSASNELSSDTGEDSNQTIGGWTQTTVGGFEANSFSTHLDPSEPLFQVQEERKKKEENEYKSQQQKTQQNKSSGSLVETRKNRGMLLLVCCIPIFLCIAGVSYFTQAKHAKEKAVAASIAEREREESIAASVEERQKEESEAAEKARQQSIAESEEARQREESKAAEREAQKEQQMKESWEQVTDLVFSSFVEGGREYMEMPIGEITRVVEARGFEGADVDGEHNFAYSGSAQYELKTDQTEMVKLSVWHESIDDPDRREQVYRFIEYEYQDFYYNEEMQSTLRKLDLPYAVYFGDTKEEIMGTLGITEEMQEWCQSDETFDFREFLLSSKLGTVYYMGSTDQNNEETVIAVGKDCMVFAMSFRADGSVVAVGIGNLKYAAMAEAMHETRNIIDSWMYLDGYPMKKLSFETYESLLLSFSGCEESCNEYGDYSVSQFSAEEENDTICFYKDSAGKEESITYSRNSWEKEKQNKFALLSGIPQEVVQILSETPDGMTEKEYFLSQMGDSADSIEDFFNGTDGGLLFYKDMLETIDIFYSDAEKVTPIGGLATSYLNGIADQKMIYDATTWDSASWGDDESYEGEWGLIYKENEDGTTDTWQYMDGNGTRYYNGGDHYIGEFAGTYRNGTGTYYWANENASIEGRWADNNPNGVCIQHSTDGSVITGIWFNGELIGCFE